MEEHGSVSAQPSDAACRAELRVGQGTLRLQVTGACTRHARVCFENHLIRTISLGISGSLMGPTTERMRLLAISPERFYPRILSLARAYPRLFCLELQCDERVRRTTQAHLTTWDGCSALSRLSREEH